MVGELVRRVRFYHHCIFILFTVKTETFFVVIKYTNIELYQQIKRGD